MALIKDINTIIDLLPVDPNINEELILKHVDSVDVKHIIPLIGQELFDHLKAGEDLKESEEQVLKFLQLAEGYLAMTKSAKFLRTQFQTTGLNSASNKNTEKATWLEFVDTVKAYLQEAYDALDNAFRVMESNLDDFELWTTSNEYQEYNSLIITKIADFQKYFNINSSGVTFHALRPIMREVEAEYINSYLGSCVDAVKDNHTARALLIPAIVNYTVAKSAEIGTFANDGQILKIQWDEFPHQKSTVMDETERSYFITSRKTSGAEYLKKVSKYLVDNPNDFPCYKPKPIGEASGRIMTTNAGMHLL